MDIVCKWWQNWRFRLESIHTRIPLFVKSAGNGAKKNIPWVCHGMSNFSGGDEGIRTLDTLASIPHFQCGALDQLCDVSYLISSYYSSSESGTSSSPSSATTFASSNNVSSSSASISLNFGSSTSVISNDSSPSDIAGVSL